MNAYRFAEVFFWAGVLLVVYTFAGYPLWMRLLARISPRPIERKGDPVPEVCVLLVAHNEASRIAARVENLLSSTYPPEKLRVLVVSDSSTDDTAALARTACGERGEALELSQRSGKATGINDGMERCTAEVIVLTDTRQRFAADTIARLAAHFADPRVGAVSGALEIESASSSTGAGVDAYWRLEKMLRHAEALFDSSIGCTGAVYAIRRELFRAVPADTILDDVVIPMQVVLAGYRVLFDEQARAFDPQPLEPAVERVRKRRTLAGNFQMLFRYPGWLLPWKNRAWWQLLSHKYLRILAPVFLATVLLSNAVLGVVSPFYRALFLGQCVFYLLALIGLAISQSRNRLLALPAGFVFLNLMTLSAFWHYLTSAAPHRWQSHRS